MTTNKNIHNTSKAHLSFVINSISLQLSDNGDTTLSGGYNRQRRLKALTFYFVAA